MTTELTSEQISEIRVAYRDAADPKKQIGILADLYCTTKQEICRVLGIEEPPKKKIRSYNQAVKKDVVKAVLLDGVSYKDAAEKFSVPYGNVSAWVQAARKKQAEFGVEPKAPAKPPEQKKGGLGERALREVQNGVEGLHQFIDNFAGVDILSEEDRGVLDRILYTADGFAAGLETGLLLAKEGSEQL